MINCNSLVFLTDVHDKLLFSGFPVFRSSAFVLNEFNCHKQHAYLNLILGRMFEIDLKR